MSMASMSHPQHTRLEQRFADLRAEGRAGLVTYIVAGDPDRAVADEILAGLPAAGADIIELGMPFTDPMADGPAIQAAALRALQGGMNLRGTLDMVARFRTTDQTTPIILMGYFNPIYSFGVDRFIEEALACGVDGLIVVDLPAEEDDELCLPALRAGLPFIRLATPTTDAQRLSVILRNASGFLYYVSVAGITGTRKASQNSIAEAVARLRLASELPIAVGFGITEPEQAAAVARVADAAVVGTAIVRRIEGMIDAAGKAKPDLAGDIHDFVCSLAKAVAQARN